MGGSRQPSSRPIHRTRLGGSSNKTSSVVEHHLTTATTVIIDCHCHAGKGDGLTGPWDTAAPLEKYLRWAAAAGISRSAIFAAFHADYAVANREVARIVASRPN